MPADRVIHTALMSIAESREQAKREIISKIRNNISRAAVANVASVAVYNSDHFAVTCNAAGAVQIICVVVDGPPGLVTD